VKLYRFLLIIPIFLLILSCSAQQSSDSEDGVAAGEPVVEIEDNETMLANIPSSDPMTIDYMYQDFEGEEIDFSATLIKSLTEEENVINEHAVYLKLVTSGLGEVNVYQCVEGNQVGYAAYTYDTENHDYTGILQVKNEQMDIDLQFRTSMLSPNDEDYYSTIDLISQDTVTATLSAEGSMKMNTMTASYNNSFESSESTLLKKPLKGTILENQLIVVSTIGVLDGIAVPAFLQFIKRSKTSEALENLDKISSKGKKSFYEKDQTNDDDYDDVYNTLVEAKPEATVMQDTIAFEQEWDCEIDEESNVVTVEATGDGLKDAGASDCIDQNDAWDLGEANLSDCNDDETDENYACMVNGVYGLITTEIRLAQRYLMCQIKGIYNLVDDGTLEDAAFGEASIRYLTYMQEEEDEEDE